MYDLLIIGAGASGLTAAITAAKAGKSVCILEKCDCIAKKIPATGNGRCNFTNSFLESSCYHGNDEWVRSVLTLYPTEFAIRYFRELGIFATDKNGYFYPYSNQAKTLVKAFEDAIKRYEISVELNWDTVSVFHSERGFSVKNSAGRSCSGRNLLIACGLINARCTGLESDFFPYIEQFGHSIRKPLPALCGFYCDGFPFKKVSGVRQNSGIRLLINGQYAGADYGEIQFTDYGLSGIPVFQLSSPAGRALYEGKSVDFELNLIQSLSETEVSDMIEKRIKEGLSPLNGLLSDKLENEIRNRYLEYKLSSDELLYLLTHLKIHVDHVRDFKYAQTASGGIPYEEIDPSTMESKIMKGLYFSGEILDVDGICGGYNLHWAWATGTIVGKQI